MWLARWDFSLMVAQFAMSSVLGPTGSSIGRPTMTCHCIPCSPYLSYSWERLSVAPLSSRAPGATSPGAAPAPRHAAALPAAFALTPAACCCSPPPWGGKKSSCHQPRSRGQPPPICPIGRLQGNLREHALLPTLQWQMLSLLSAISL